jgi:hypothetical protein
MRPTFAYMPIIVIPFSLVACAAEEHSGTTSPIDVRNSEGLCPVTNVINEIPGAEKIIAVDIFPVEPESPDLRATSSQCHEEDGTPVDCPNFDVSLVEADMELDEHYGTGELDDYAAGTILTRNFKLDGDGGMILLEDTGKLESDGVTGTFEVFDEGNAFIASTIYEFGNCEWTKLGLNRFDEYVLAIEVGAPGAEPELRQNTWFHIDASIWTKFADFDYQCRVTVGGTRYEARLSLENQFVYALSAVDAATGGVIDTRSSVIGAPVEIDDTLAVSAGGLEARLAATSLARWDARTPATKRDGDLPEQFVRLDRMPDPARSAGAWTCETVAK